MLLQVFYFIISVVGLYFGAEISLESSERIGKAWKMSPLLIGMFIVGFGTSLPEFFVSQLACYRGIPSMAMGNIIGSNIANVFLILGVSSIFYPIGLEGKELSKQFNYHLILTIIVGIFLFYAKINIITFLVMVIFFIFYFYFNMNSPQSEPQDSDIAVSKLDYLKIFLGFSLLYGSGELLVFSGANIGRHWGISEFAISAIFVAFGTSFPELVTALLASYRKKNTELIIGNVIGSNIFNGAFVLGSIGFYHFDVEHDYTLEMLVLLLVSFLFILFNRLKIRISKKISIIFLALYFSFVYFWLN